METLNTHDVMQAIGADLQDQPDLLAYFQRKEQELSVWAETRVQAAQFHMTIPDGHYFRLILETVWRRKRPPKMKPQWISDMGGQGKAALIVRSNKLSLFPLPFYLLLHSSEYRQTFTKYVQAIGKEIEKRGEGKLWLVQATLLFDRGNYRGEVILSSDYWRNNKSEEEDSIKWSLRSHFYHPLASYAKKED